MSTVLELRCLLADILFDSNGRFLPNEKHIRSTNYILMFVFVEKRHDMSVSFWKRKAGKFGLFCDVFVRNPVCSVKGVSQSLGPK